ncbi:Uu.00g063980.m01.CDS01 [Anthostomella pinea]|uniref:Uu.00g063980.m01.CDS01 n=1 Tax=Anthostomella pinea TaxID=933095 RepID=A0AAI8YN11_9PEZI|nr:Uu.00g063980.m01.CDS01 [Anthostomella pinea]
MGVNLVVVAAAMGYNLIQLSPEILAILVAFWYGKKLIVPYLLYARPTPIVARPPELPKSSYHQTTIRAHVGAKLTRSQALGPPRQLVPDQAWQGLQAIPGHQEMRYGANDVRGLALHVSQDRATQQGRMTSSAQHGQSSAGPSEDVAIKHEENEAGGNGAGPAPLEGIPDVPVYNNANQAHVENYVNSMPSNAPNLLVAEQHYLQIIIAQELANRGVTDPFLIRKTFVLQIRPVANAGTGAEPVAPPANQRLTSIDTTRLLFSPRSPIPNVPTLTLTTPSVPSSSYGDEDEEMHDSDADADGETDEGCTTLPRAVAAAAAAETERKGARPLNEETIGIGGNGGTQGMSTLAVNLGKPLRSAPA